MVAKFSLVGGAPTHSRFFFEPPFPSKEKGDSPLDNYLPSKNESPPTEKRTPPLLKNEASSHEMIPRNKIQMWETPIDSVSLRKQIKKLTVILKNIRSCLEQNKFHKESEIVGKYCITWFIAKTLTSIAPHMLPPCLDSNSSSHHVIHTDRKHCVVSRANQRVISISHK